MTAEGVDTQLQHDTVTGIGCEFAQGFRYSVPVPSSDVVALLRAGLDRSSRRSGPILSPSEARRGLLEEGRGAA